MFTSAGETTSNSLGNQQVCVVVYAGSRSADMVRTAEMLHPSNLAEYIERASIEWKMALAGLNELRRHIVHAFRCSHWWRRLHSR